MEMAYSDQQTKRDVVDQLVWDSRVDAARISVRVENAKVILSGSVPTISESRAAEEDAWLIQGVRGVENHLEVSYPALPSDQETAANVRFMLNLNPYIDSSRIDAKVTAGMVNLQGSVDAVWKRKLTEDVTANVVGVLGIVNELTVVPRENVVDQVIAQEIASAVKRHAHLDIEGINVKVENAVVTLSGVVPNGRALVEAYRTALFTRGVRDVKSELIIAGPEG